MKKIKTVQKNMRFPNRWVEVLEEEGENMGMNFTQYAKQIIGNEVMRIARNKENDGFGFPIDEELIRDIKEARSEVRKGDVRVLRSDEDIDKFLDDVWED